MRQARESQFDPSSPPWLHCISRCVRRAFLCGEGFEHRRAWIERRLRLLSACFSVEIGAYAVMSNHLHVVLRPRPEAVADWSDEQVALAWWRIRNDVDPWDPAPDPELPQAPDPEELTALRTNQAFVARWRERLGSVSWFMKALKEPLSRLANREDDCTGAFWEGRFQSIPLLDQAAVVACMAYVDLNPIRAQLATTPEASAHTSVATRIAQRQARAQAATQRRRAETAAARQTLRQAALTPVAAPDASAAQRQDPADEAAYRSWLVPTQEVTAFSADTIAQSGWSLDDYLALVDATGRVMRSDKRGAIPAELASLLSRLQGGSGERPSVEAWLASVARPRGLRGTALGSTVCLAAEAARRGLAWLQVRCSLFARRAAAGVASS